MAIDENKIVDGANDTFDTGYKKKVSLFQVKEIFYGVKEALGFMSNLSAVVAWDDTTTPDTVYLKYLSGKIDKISLTAKTILTAQSGGTWANRATSNVYTEGGV